MCQRLKTAISECGLSQRRLAALVGISPTALCFLINKGQIPRSGWPTLRTALHNQLTAHGCPESSIDEALAALDAAIQPSLPTTPQEDDSMIIRKQSLTMETRQHFKLLRSPFVDPQCPEDVYLTPKIRYVREAMYDAAVNGNFLAVVGESGSGKSTLREELLDRLRAEGQPVIVIEPSTLGMAETAVNGRVLRAAHIMEAIITTLAPCSGSDLI